MRSSLTESNFAYNNCLDSPFSVARVKTIENSYFTEALYNQVIRVFESNEFTTRRETSACLSRVRNRGEEVREGREGGCGFRCRSGRQRVGPARVLLR